MKRLWIVIVVLMLASVAEAGAIFPAGKYKKDGNTMSVSSDGDYQITYVYDGETKNGPSGFALHEGAEVCTRGGSDGNLWTVNSGGSGQCYAVAIRGKRLIIDHLGDSRAPLGGIWAKQ